jgi:hypothetical protein
MRTADLVAAVLLTAMPACAKDTRVFDVEVTGAIAEVPLTLIARRDDHTIELRDVDAGASPVLHVLGPDGRDVPGLTRLSEGNGVRLPAEAAGRFTLVVRSQAGDGHHADVWVDGALVQRAVAFSAGTRLALKDLSVEEEVIAAGPPLGLASHTAYLLSRDGSQIVARASGPSTAVGALERGDAVVLYASAASGRLGVYRNDRATDADADGLGDRLEGKIGTCANARASAPGVSCAAISDTRDTDGDGLWDLWEVSGKYAFVNNAWEIVPLPAWGADPRHKDIFIEVDFRRLTQQDNINGVAQHMLPAVARQMAATYADQATTDPAMRTAHAQDVGNPDGEPGISLHLDTGVPPETPADATIYGDWGGYSAVNAVSDGIGGFRPQTPGEAMPNNLAEARRGLFHYVLGYTSGGGACGVGIACGFNFFSSTNSSHEFGHTLWLDHNGPAGTHEPNCKPNYPSLMNYAYSNAGYMLFSDGRSFPPLNNHALVESGMVPDPSWTKVLRSTFGYRVDTVTGSVDWDRDGVFQPAGSPVRGYANFRPGDSGGCEFTREGEVFVGTMSARSPAVVRYNGMVWIFSVTLDHRLEYAYTSAPWTCPNVDDCPIPSFPYHVVHDIGPIDALDAAAIKVNGNWIVIIVGVRPDGSLFERWMHMSGWNIVWESTETVPGSPAAGEPSLAVSRDGASVALAYKGTDNIVRYRTRAPAAWRPEEQVIVAGQPLTMHSAASPGLAFTGLPSGVVAGQESLVGAFADPGGYIRLYVRGGYPNFGWTTLGIPYASMYSGIGRPAMAWTGTASTNLRDGGAAPVPGTAGRFYILYIESNAPVGDVTNPNPVRMAMSYVDNNGTFRIGLPSYFDNVWSYAFGVDLLQPNEVGLRAAETYSIPKPAAFQMISFRPHADGISNLPYSNKNDWSVLAWGTCSVLAASQPPGPTTNCAVKPF